MLLLLFFLLRVIIAGCRLPTTEAAAGDAATVGVDMEVAALEAAGVVATVVAMALVAAMAVETAAIMEVARVMEGAAAVGGEVMIVGAGEVGMEAAGMAAMATTTTLDCLTRPVPPS